MNKIIILLSGKARSGKDQTYEFMKEYFNDKCQRWAFADKLKNICKDYFNWDGNKDENGRDLLIKAGQMLRGEVSYSNGNFIIDGRYYSPKDRIYNDIFVIDIFYRLLNDHKPYKDFWVEKIWDKIMENKFEINVITDFRFLNEYKYFWNRKENGNFIIKTINIKRDNSLRLDDRSETELDNFKFDIIIDNNGSLEDLKDNILNICKEIDIL